MILLDNLRKSFGPKTVYSGVSLEVERGETHVVIGRSGEGKSVMLKMISALMEPDEGTVIVDGVEVDMHRRSSVQHVRDRVTMVFQMGALFDSLTVRENVGFYLDQKRDRSKAEVDALCEELLEEVNLPDSGHLLPAELSGGMRKRVGLARALAAEPQIILYDEPTTGLDPVTTDVIGDLIMRTARRHDVTSIVVSHDMKSASKVGDRISMLYNGRIIFTGTAPELERSNDPVIFQFVNGLAQGPITETEEESVHRMSNELVNKSLMLRKMRHRDDV